MDTSTRQRTSARTRALRRLRSMTIGTALAGAAATTGLGWLAAITHPGTTATVASVGSTTTGTTSTTTGTTGTTGTTTTGATSTTVSPTATATPTPTPTTTTVSGSSQGGHVSTGGS